MDEPLDLEPVKAHLAMVARGGVSTWADDYVRDLVAEIERLRSGGVVDVVDPATGESQRVRTLPYP